MKLHSLLQKLGVLLGVALLIVCPFALSVHASGSTSPAGTYVDDYLPSDSLTSMTYDLTINRVANLGKANYFWSHEIYFTGAPSNGSAYIGLQGINLALFSVFDYTSPEASSDCLVQQTGFDGGAYSFGGTACHLTYTVTQGHTYRLQVAEISKDSKGINWQATVKDLSTGKTTIIGTVNVAASWGAMTNAQDSWTEYFGPQISSCSSLPYSNVTFSNFTADNGRYTAPLSHVDQITQNNCTHYSRITDNSNNSFTEEMGIDPPVSQTIVPLTSTPPASSTTTNSASTKTAAPAKPKPKSLPKKNIPKTASKPSSSTIKIKVVDILGDPVAGADVYLNTGNRAITDSSGIATFSNLTPGNYKLSIDSNRFAAFSTTITVKADASSNQTQQLEYRLAAKISKSNFTIILSLISIGLAVILVIVFFARRAKKSIKLLNAPISVQTTPDVSTMMATTAKTNSTSWQTGLSTIGSTTTTSVELEIPSTAINSEDNLNIPTDKSSIIIYPTKMEPRDNESKNDFKLS